MGTRVNALVFSNCALPSTAVTSLKFYNLIVVTSEEFAHLVEDAGSNDDTRFMRHCGAVPKFIAFSTLWRRNKCKILLTVGDRDMWVKLIAPQPFQIRRRWLHFDSYANIDNDKLSSCVLCGNNLCEPWLLKNTFGDCLLNDEEGDVLLSSPLPKVRLGRDPLISVFSSTYHSGEVKLGRALQSMLWQTFNNWEWVIVDDSKTDEMKPILRRMADQDLRIRVIDIGHSGYIGEAKWTASQMCRGEWLVELDHDDRLMPTLLGTIANIMVAKPDVGVIYSDFCAMTIHDNQFESAKYYPHTTAFGFGGYFTTFVRGQWHACYQAQSMNWITTTDIVGVPNHVRSYSKKLYDEVRGSNYDLNVADDYDIMIRLFLTGKPWVRIAGQPMYIQYDNPNSDNHTYLRNGLIRHLQHNVSANYRSIVAQYFVDAEELKNDNDNAIFPTTLAKPGYTGQGSWERPETSSLHTEFTWQMGRLYPPNRHYKRCQNLVQLFDRSQAYSGVVNGTRQIATFISKQQLTIILLVDKDTMLAQLQSYLEALLALNVVSPVYIVAHPDSVVRALQKVSAAETDLFTLARNFKIWAWGIGTANYTNGFEAWVNKPRAQTMNHLANYGLGTLTRTSHILYLDASVGLSETLCAVLQCKAEGFATSVPEEVNESESLWGWAGSRDLGSLHGFYHHTTLPELYGYWPLDGSDPAALVEMWRARRIAAKQV